MWGRLPDRNQLMSDPVLLGWNVSGAISLFLPLFIMVVARCVNVDEDGEGNNDNNNNNNNNNDNENNNGHWWNRWYNNRNNGEGGDGDGEQGSGDRTPWWWWGGREEGEPEDEGKGALVFVYIWMWFLFASLVLYGNFVFRRGSDYGGLQGALIMFTNLALIAMILITGLGAIETEGRELEEKGWYGQLSVCIFLTCLYWVINGIVFCTLLRKRNMNNNSHSNNYYGTGSDGLVHEQPSTFDRFMAAWDPPKKTGDV
jgi:hypothetical protein